MGMMGDGDFKNTQESEMFLEKTPTPKPKVIPKDLKNQQKKPPPSVLGAPCL
jgi:hypothetical protein